MICIFCDFNMLFLFLRHPLPSPGTGEGAPRSPWFVHSNIDNICVCTTVGIVYLCMGSLCVWLIGVLCAIIIFECERVFLVFFEDRVEGFQLNLFKKPDSMQLNILFNAP
jgi:hypothetical protein